jgi:hypothetical protein
MRPCACHVMYYDQCFVYGYEQSRSLLICMAQVMFTLDSTWWEYGINGLCHARRSAAVSYLNHAAAAAFLQDQSLNDNQAASINYRPPFPDPHPNKAVFTLCGNTARKRSERGPPRG